MREREKNSSKAKGTVDFVAKAEKIVNAYDAKTKKKPINKPDLIVNSILLICCITLAGLLIYLL